jgi:hypothetical protein
LRLPNTFYILNGIVSFTLTSVNLTSVILTSVILTSVILTSVYAKYCNAECFQQFHNSAKCHSDEWHNAECRGGCTTYCQQLRPPWFRVLDVDLDGRRRPVKVEDDVLVGFVVAQPTLDDLPLRLSNVLSSRLH